MVKKVVVNVQCGNDEGFLWSVVTSLYPARKNVNRTSSYPHFSTMLRTDAVHLPVTLDQLKNFEGSNDVSVNVYLWSDGGCAPLRLTERKREKHANLLLVQDQRNAQRYHFACIRNLSRLLSKQLSKHDGRVFVCDR